MTKIICVECGKVMTELYLEQNWCKECHTKYHMECKKENKDIYEWCIGCCGQKDCGIVG